MAVRLCSYQSIREFYALSFIDWQEDETRLLEIIVPSPDLADILRERLKAHPEYDRLTVSTISYFISKKLRHLECPKPVIRKAHILLHFSTIWQTYFKGYDFALFSSAYEVFSDWRSYSIDLALFEEALNSLDPIIKKAVMFFWTYLEQMEFLDEHGAYDYLAKNHQTKIENKDLLFFGFTHLSGTQISMFQSFAESAEIYLPVHEKVLDKCQATDWVSWLSPLKKKEYDHTPIALGFSAWSTFEKTELNMVLQRSCEKCLMLGAQDALGHLAEVHEEGDFFKLSYDFLKIDEQRFSEKFKKIVLANNREHCELFLVNEKKRAIENKNWRELKIIELYNEALEFLIKVDLEYDYFIFSVIRHYVQLNLPRNYVLTVNETVEKEILRAEYLWAPDLRSPVDVVVKGDDSIFKTGSLDYSSQVFKALASIGPIQRLGLRGEWLKYHLNEVLSLGGEIFIEEGLLETSSFWKQQANFNEAQLKAKREHLGVKDYFWKLNLSEANLASLKTKTFSPSELQRYIDCPRSYLVSYGISLDPKVKNDEEVQASVIGELEHYLVELYFKNNDFLNEEKLTLLGLKTLEENLAKTHKKISTIDKEVILEELITYSHNVLEKLYKLKGLSGFTYEFEKEFKNPNLGLHGRVDFYFQSAHGHGIIDFKRSKIASFSEVSKVQVIQLWSYLFGLGLNLDECTLEYFNLSTPDKSWGMGKNSEHHLIKLPRGYRPDIEESALAGLKETISSLRSDSQFQINPRRSQICQFCPASALCPRVNREKVRENV